MQDKENSSINASTHTNKFDVADVESSIESREEGYPAIYMNHSRELKVSEMANDQDGMTDDPVLERRPDPCTPVNKIV